MLRTLKILCILLKVLMLTKTAIVSTDLEDLENLEDLEDLEDLENLEDSGGSGRSGGYEEDHLTHNQGIPIFQSIDVRAYMSSNIESVQNYSEIVTVKNEVALQEGTIPSPEGIPSEPTFPRAFVEFDNRLNKTDIFVTFRWNKSEFTNKTIQKYRVQYWSENVKKIQTIDIIPANNMILQHKVYNLKPDTMYYFKVQAHNEVGAGPYTKFINVSTTHENPVPLLLINSYPYIHILDVDLQISFKLNKYNDYKEMVYSALEHKFYGITYENELITLDFNLSAIATKPNYTKIADLNAFASDLCIDWVAKNLYWITYEIIYKTYNIMKLDLTLWKMGIVKYDNILKREDIYNLNVQPFTGHLYWMERERGSYAQGFMQSDFDGRNVKSLKNESDECFCPYKQLNDNRPVMHIDHTNIDKPLVYWTSNDRLFAEDIYGCRCTPILSAGNAIYLRSLAIGKINIYFFQEDKLLNVLKKKYVFLDSKENAFKHVQKFNISLNIQHPVTVLDKSLQSYPSTRCLTPNMKDYRVEEVLITDKRITANSIVVSLPEPILNDGCEKYNLATTIYTISVSYWTCLDNDLSEFKKFKVQTYEKYYEFQNLTPFTEYTLKLALSNFYVDKLSMGLQFGADVKLSTTGKLNAPENVTAQVLTPTLAIVYWMPPKKLNCMAVNYEVHWMSVFFPNGTRRITPQHDKQLIIQPEHTVDGKFFTTIQSLLPGQKYLIYLRVYPTNFNNSFTDSLSKIIYMYSEPNNLVLSGVSTNGMNISWIPSVILMIHYKLEYKNDAMRKWQIANNTEVNNGKVTYYIKNLLPRSKYKFRLILRYPEYMEDFVWSPDERFTFQTLGDVTKIPSAPGIPTITRLPNFTYQLNWEPAQANDSQYLTMYRLEGLIIEENYKEGNQTEKNEHWNLYYNGTNNYWIITIDMNKKYRFRVQAENPYGCGVWSKSSVVVDLTKSIDISAMQYLPYLYNYVPLISSIIVTLVICYVYYFYCSYRQRIKLSNEIVVPPIMTDIELITLNEIPSGNVQLNTLYATRSQHNPDKFALTIIEKKQITLGELLGSGAFGEVFQGTVKDFEGSDATPVAIKMLQKDSSSQEKKKFLQEAKFMSQFRHKHVLRLLGICSDADSPMLILELMEGGDLLKYLRESRTLELSDSHFLRLQDLLTMCEDVARGCCYLKELHFVHRDLACRNCLISARNRENRIVKIGDFGLARDIYKNDYYRMKGEGLLPIRWMAPESLMDGIFTFKSDVWAFGVLMWEIMSLGQRPYCAKNDSQVLQYVCAGGKLSKPLNCPLTLYQLMLRCWNAVNERPNFIVCLKNITTLRDNIEDAMLSSVDTIKCAELPLSGQIEDVVGSTASHTCEHLTANDASNDVIEALT